MSENLIIDRQFLVIIQTKERGTKTPVTLKYATKGGPSAADEYIPGKLVQPLSIKVGIGADNYCAGGAYFSSGLVNIAIDADDDIIGNLIFSGSTIEILQGAFEDDYAAYTRILLTQIESVRWEDGSLTINLRNSRQQFQRIVQGTIYDASYMAGLGIANPNTELYGSAVPSCYGRCLNVEPTPIDLVNFKYQVHWGRINSVTAVYFNGVEATPAVDWDADIATGVITIIGNPLGVVTCDVNGNAPGAVYVDSPADLALGILQAGYWNQGINTQSFTDLNAIYSGEAGLYISSYETMRLEDVLSALLQEIGAWWLVDVSNELRVGMVYDPSAGGIPGPFVETWTDNDLTGLRKVSEIQAVKNNYFNHSRNWRVLFESEIAGAVLMENNVVPADQSAFLQQQWRTVEYQTGTIESLSGTDRTFDTPVANELDAIDLSNIQGKQHDEIRDIYEATQNNVDLTLLNFSSITLEYPRWGLDGGRGFVVIAQDIDLAADQVRYTLWG